jgi:hypothetical protein
LHENRHVRLTRARVICGFATAINVTFACCDIAFVTATCTRTAVARTISDRLITWRTARADISSRRIACGKDRAARITTGARITGARITGTRATARATASRIGHNKT